MYFTGAESRGKKLWSVNVASCQVVQTQSLCSSSLSEILSAWIHPHWNIQQLCMRKNADVQYLLGVAQNRRPFCSQQCSRQCTAHLCFSLSRSGVMCSRGHQSAKSQLMAYCKGRLDAGALEWTVSDANCPALNTYSSAGGGRQGQSIKPGKKNHYMFIDMKACQCALAVKIFESYS